MYVIYRSIGGVNGAAYFFPAPNRMVLSLSLGLPAPRGPDRDTSRDRTQHGPSTVTWTGT